MTRCTIKTNTAKSGGRLPWISVHVASPAQPVHSLVIYVYDPSGPTIAKGGQTLGSYEVWTGQEYGDRGTQCSVPSASEPEHDGVPVSVACHGVVAPYVTLQLVGEAKGRDRQIFLSELHVFRPSPPPPHPLPPAPTPWRAGEVAKAVNQRYEAAKPSGVLGEAGVLVHIYDGFESGDEPWDTCHADCVRGAVDTVSASLISRNLPWLFEAEARWGQVGLIIAPDTEVLCAFYHDAGSGGHPNGKCPFPPNSGKHSVPPHQGRPLGVVMKEHFEACAGERNPFTGILKRNGHCNSGYNEILVGWMHWEMNLPWAVEAFMYGGGPGAWEANRARALDIQRNFLQRYGLTANDVPLLRYDCGPGGPHGGQPYTLATAPVGECFVEA